MKRSVLLLLEEVYLRIAVDEDATVDEEENNEFIEENCFDVFNDKLVYHGYEYYFSQYEGLFIKSFRIAYRSYLILIFICCLAISIKFFLNSRKSHAEIIFNFDDCSHLKQHNVFIAFTQNNYRQRESDQLRDLIHKRSPSTQLFTLTNMTNITEFNHLLYSK